MFMTGYKQGKTSLLKILKNGTIDRIINSFSIVGLMVVGSMAATRVTVNTPLAIKVGEGTTTIQSLSLIHIYTYAASYAAESRILG